MMNSSVQQKKCGVILIHNDEFYLVVYSKKSKKFGFPKGGQEFAESNTRTALRELEEETGYSFQDSKFRLNGKNTMKVHNNLYFIVPFYCDDRNEFLKDSGIKDTTEISYKVWLTKEELQEIPSKKKNVGLNYFISKKLY